MNFILVIKGVTLDEYKAIKQDLAEQFQAKGLEVPVFAMLPQDYAEIEVLWIDEGMEKENFALSLAEQFKRDYDRTRAINS